MKAFSIENETNKIIIHASAEEAEAIPDAESFGNEAALARLAANWPAARLVEIWNSLPGETPVKKFKDRATAISRIWKAAQSLSQSAPFAADETAPPPETVPISDPHPAAADESTQVSGQTPESSDTVQLDAAISENPEFAADTTIAVQTAYVEPRKAPAKTRATRAKKAPKPATNAVAPREGSKTSQVIAMLRREGGTTLEEIMTAMGWLKHTTRAMMSAGGSLTKKHGLVITSEKIGAQRTYSIKS